MIISLFFVFFFNAYGTHLDLPVRTHSYPTRRPSDLTITVGSKNFGESNVLAQMFAILIRERGIPVAGPIEYPSTQSVLEALKRGDIDIYPDYNGTGLVMIGQNPLADGDAATARVQELYAPLGLTWLPRLGFATNYGLALRADRARELDVDS